MSPRRRTSEPPGHGRVTDRWSRRPVARRAQERGEVAEGESDRPSRRGRGAVVVLDDGAQVGERGTPEDVFVRVRPPVRGREVHGRRRPVSIEEDLPVGAPDGADPSSMVGVGRDRDPPVDLARRGGADRLLEGVALGARPAGGRERIAARRDRLCLQCRRRPGGGHLRDPFQIAVEREAHRERERAVRGSPDAQRPREAPRQARPFGMATRRGDERERPTDEEGSAGWRGEPDRIRTLPEEVVRGGRRGSRRRGGRRRGWRHGGGSARRRREVVLRSGARDHDEQDRCDAASRRPSERRASWVHPLDASGPAGRVARPIRGFWSDRIRPSVAKV